MRLNTIGLFIILVFFLVPKSLAQGTLADYKRAIVIDTLFNNKVYNNPSSFTWLEDDKWFWYLNPITEGKEFIKVNVEGKVKTSAFDHSRLADTLSLKLGSSINAFDLPFSSIEFSKDLSGINFQIDSAKWKCNLTDYSCTVVEIVNKEPTEQEYWGNFFDERGSEIIVSPDSIWIGFIKNSNVFIKQRISEEEYQLSYDGSPGEFYSSYMKWSPDSRYLMAYKVSPGEKRQIFFVESSPKDQLQPKLCYRDYNKPGDMLTQRKPQLFSIEGKKNIPVTDELFRDQFDLSGIEWRKDSRGFTFEINQRGHQVYRVLEVAASSGRVKVLVEENSRTFIDYSSKKYRYDVNDGNEIIWASERDGWNHLYLYDGLTGAVKNQITKGNWVVRNVVHVDTLSRKVIFAASGIDKDMDPYLIQYCSINFDGSGFKRLTKENADHSATFSGDYQFFVDKFHYFLSIRSAF